jgi:hypothetical protein
MNGACTRRLPMRPMWIICRLFQENEIQEYSISRIPPLSLFVLT